MLEPIAKHVILIHRRDKFRAHEHSVGQLTKVEILTPYQIKELIGKEKLEKIIVTNNKTNNEKTIELDDLIVNFGFISSLGPIKDWELEIEKGSIAVNSKMETNIPGIYAASDICKYPGKVKLTAVLEKLL